VTSGPANVHRMGVAAPSAQENDSTPGNGYDADVARGDWQAAAAAIDLALAAPDALGGVVLRGRHGPVRDALLERAGRTHRMERLAAGSADEALDEALDVAATLTSGHAVRRQDLLARLDTTPGGALLIIGADRLSVRAADRLARWLESPQRSAPVIALDESDDEQDGAPGFIESALGERLALHVRLPEMSLADLCEQTGAALPGTTLTGARSMRACPHEPVPGRPDEAATGTTSVSDDLVADLVRLARALGIGSARAPIAAIAASRAAARLDGRAAATLEDSALAARLVLAPRAVQPLEASDATEGDPQTAANDGANEPDTPGQDDTASAEAPEAAEPDASPGDTDPTKDALPADAPTASDEDETPAPPISQEAEELPEKLVAAVSAALPPNLLGSLAAGLGRGGRSPGRHGGGATRAARGRPAGVARPRASDHGRRLDIVATLKAAVPWQRLRAPTPGHAIPGGATPAVGTRARLAVRPSDFRIRRYTRPTRTTTVFIVDASGSAAMHRIGEAKGALEAVLAECYVRRDRVALISFRGAAATLELPPTRSLARARRSLVGLAAGGGTPIAAGLDLASNVLQDIVRGGERAVGIIMSDGRANVGRDGLGGRATAQADAEHAAERLRGIGARLLFVDTAPRPRPIAAQLAERMGARYLPLPLRGGGRALPDLLAASA